MLFPRSLFSTLGLRKRLDGSCNVHVAKVFTVILLRRFKSDRDQCNHSSQRGFMNIDGITVELSIGHFSVYRGLRFCIWLSGQSHSCEFGLEMGSTLNLPGLGKQRYTMLQVFYGVRHLPHFNYVPSSFELYKTALGFRLELTFTCLA